MRLLNVHTLLFKEFADGQIPGYIIASHRWLEQDDEATYKSMLKKKDRDVRKGGYTKIEKFCEFIREAKTDVEWLWIDTCCIDKNSSAELQESINSMFRWYRRARCCLAFLSDVGHSACCDEGDGSRKGEEARMEDFKASVWFTRAWTLQELLAPTTVLFVDRDWKRIGYKGRVLEGMRDFVGCNADLTGAISEVTGIRESVLYDYSTSRRLSFEEKQQWVVGRETTREEDKAYCLMGIFNVSMPLVYGEKKKAQTRLLKEIKEKERERQMKREKREAEKQAAKQAKEWKRRAKREKEKRELALQPILEEHPLDGSCDPTEAPTAELSAIRLLPPASEYEDESTKEHRHAAIVSSTRILWYAKRSRDKAIQCLARSLEQLGHEDPGESIHHAIHHTVQRAQQAQTAYLDMLQLGWSHERACRYIETVLQSFGHSERISEALAYEYLIFDPRAIDVLSIPYIPPKASLLLAKPDEATSSEMSKNINSSDLVFETVTESGHGSIIVEAESQCANDAKLSGAGTSRQAGVKVVEQPEAEMTLDVFMQMHLFC